MKRRLPKSQRAVKFKKNSCTDQDAGYARQLATALRNNGRVCRATSLSRSAEAFRLLREADGASAEQIEQVLRWYETHFSDEFTPRAFTPQEFREKFARIQDTMFRQQASPRSIIDLGQVQPSTEARLLALRISETMYWPGRAGLQLESWLEANLQAFARFRTLALENYQDDSRLFSMWFPQTAVRLTDGWASLIHERYAAWSQWNGDLTHLVWNPDHKHNDKFLAWHGIELATIAEPWKHLTALWKAES